MTLISDLPLSPPSNFLKPEPAQQKKVDVVPQDAPHPTTKLFITAMSLSYQPEALTDDPSLEQSTAIPAMTNVVLMIPDIVDTVKTLYQANKVKDRATINALVLHFFSEIASIGQGIISSLQTLFTLFHTLPPEKLLIVAFPAAILGLIICAIEGAIEIYRLISEVKFLKSPLFLAKKFLSISSSKNPKESLYNYMLQIQANRKEFDEIFGEEKVNLFLEQLHNLYTSMNKTAPYANQTQDVKTDFEKMKGTVLQFHLAYFCNKYFDPTQKRKEIVFLDQQIKLLENSENKDLVLQNISNSPHEALKAEFNIELENPSIVLSDDLHRKLVQAKSCRENQLPIAQNYLRKHLSAPMVQQLLRDQPVLETLQSEDTAFEGKTEKAEKLLSLLNTQVIKKVCFHAIMIITILITVAALALSLAPGGFFLLPLLLFGIAFVVGTGGYVFEKSVLPEIGWSFDIKKSIPSFIKSIPSICRKVKDFFERPIQIGIGPENGFKFHRQ